MNKHGLYQLPSLSKAYLVTNKSDSFNLWHSRLGHPYSKTLRTIVKENQLSISSKSSSPCSSYFLGKFAKLPFASVEHSTKAPFEIIHSDVWGPSPILSNLGFKYFMHFVDDFNHFTWIFFLSKTK